MGLGGWRRVGDAAWAAASGSAGRVRVRVVAEGVVAEGVVGVRVVGAGVGALVALLIATLVPLGPAGAIGIRVDAGRRLSIGAFLDVAADGDDQPLGDSGDFGNRGLEGFRVRA